MKKIIPISLLFLTVSLSTIAQPKNQKRVSALAISTYKFEETYIKVTYSQPAKNGRKVFGELVPYGKVWRTGANEATEITITKPVNILGQTVVAGTYTIFTIPQQKSWTFILNTELGQWGAFKYDEKKNAYSFKVTAEQTTEINEVFMISFEPGEAQAVLVMTWENVRVAIPISFIKEPSLPVQME